MTGANPLVAAALVAFLVAVAGSLLLLSPRRAVVVTLLGGWMFLPHFDGRLDVPLLHTKEMFVPAVVLLGSVVFDAGRWRMFRPRMLDLAMAVLCASPFVTALDNGLGGYEALSASFELAMAWGAPYLLGRAYFRSPRALRDLASVLAAAALLYVPLCLWEIRMSPHLHHSLYGFTPSSFLEAIRLGGYRPIVFMAHGLAVGMFMACGTLAAFWLWRTDSSRELWGMPMGWVCAGLAATTLLCKSTGAIALLAMGALVLEGTRYLRVPALVLALAAVPPAYCAARVAGWNGGEIVTAVTGAVSAERAASVAFRIQNENLLLVKAMFRPWLGWGRWGRSRVYDDQGNDVAITDGRWILHFGMNGLVGLVALLVSLALPAVALLRTLPARRWEDPRVAPAAALVVAVLLFAIDGLLNDMTSPVFPLIGGATLSLCLSFHEARSARAGARRRPSVPAAGAPSHA